MKRILITGVAGFLGSHLADVFFKQGNSVIGIDNLIGGYLDNVPEGVDFYNYDLNDFDTIEKYFKDVDIVIHTACTAYEGLSVFSPAFITKNTANITTTVLTASIKYGVKKFVNMSSMARYGTQDTLPFTEDMTPKPQDPYGISKVYSEQLIKNLCSTHSMEYTILVPHNIIGPRQKYDDPYRNVASIMINRMLQGKQPIIYGDGNQVRCFSFIQDVVDPIMAACDLNTANGMTINIGPDEEFITINVLAAKIANILDFDLDPIYFPARPQEVLHAVCSSDLARKVLNYKTTTSLDDGLKQLCDWIKEKGSKPFQYHLPVELVNDKTPKTWTDNIFNEK